MTRSSVPKPTPRMDTVLDSVSGAMFAVFVAFLFLGFLDPGVPYEGLSILPLAIALGTTLWANLRSERSERAHVVAPAA